LILWPLSSTPWQILTHEQVLNKSPDVTSSIAFGRLGSRKAVHKRYPQSVTPAQRGLAAVKHTYGNKLQGKVAMTMCDKEHMLPHKLPARAHLAGLHPLLAALLYIAQAVR
jgi:hypothetical protein